MNERLTIQDLIDLLAAKQGISKKDAEVFVKEFFLLIEQALEKDKNVKIKGLGTFKLIDVDSRESVNINTGERFQIKGHTKVSFSPDTSLRDTINKPFAHFETVVLNAGTVLEDTPVEMEGEEEDAVLDDVAAEDMATEEVATEDVAADNPAVDIAVAEHIASADITTADVTTETVATETVSTEDITTECSVNENVISQDATVETAVSIADSPEEDTAKQEGPVEPEVSAESEGGAESDAPAAAVSIESVTPVESEGGAESDAPAQREHAARMEEAHVTDSQDVVLNAVEEEKAASAFNAELKEDNNPAPKEKSVLSYLIAAIVVVLLLCGGILVSLYYPDFLLSQSTEDENNTLLAAEQEVQPEIMYADSVGQKDSVQAAVKEVLPDTVVNKKTRSAEVAMPISKKKQREEVSAEKVNKSTPKTAPSTMSKAAPSTTAKTTLPTTPKATSPTTYSDDVNYKIVGTKTNHTVKAGETLTRISLRYYGTKAMWPYIVKHNKGVIKNPDNVPYGTKIKIPELAKE